MRSILLSCHTTLDCYYEADITHRLQAETNVELSVGVDATMVWLDVLAVVMVRVDTAFLLASNLRACRVVEAVQRLHSHCNVEPTLACLRLAARVARAVGRSRWDCVNAVAEDVAGCRKLDPCKDGIELVEVLGDRSVSAYL